ncbi:MAG: D-TA family PLP-dependent enzyme [Christensenellales bacterium]|jgi:D-serine deaminase-like pyridoxal phosphate-dependent protein
MRREDFTLREPERIPSPALILYKDRVLDNTRRAIDIAGGADRLWPHVKSHKMDEMVRMQIDLGISRFKCATIAELRMIAACGAAHALMAYPLIGPSIGRFLDVAAAHPGTEFYAIGDSIEGMRMLSDAAAARGMRIKLLLDINMGMNRTGLAIERIEEMAGAVADFAGIQLIGLHCYDGHIRETEVPARAAAAQPALARVLRARDELQLPIVIAGGSPTLSVHAQAGVYLSPGTVFLWDYGYATRFPDLPFACAAAVMARVISHPAEGLFTLDCGSKAIAADPAGVRGVIAGYEDAQHQFQSEEHWVFRAAGDAPAIGTVLYIIPTHICPTSALYDEAIIAEGGEILGTWTVSARARERMDEAR